MRRQSVDARGRRRRPTTSAGRTPVRLRHDWRRDEVNRWFGMPLLELAMQAATIHRRYHDPREMQVCRLVSLKTGGCPEDCTYCAQSSRYATGVTAEPMLDRATVLAIARSARINGVSRLCMGAAWREVRDNASFDRVLGLVREVTALGLEVCCTLGMLTEQQARRLEEAGLYAYNHNLDTSPEYYETIITTRTQAERLRTIENLRKTKVSVCCGGIVGMGESRADRVALLQTLANLRPHPESVPINLLAKIPGTPLESEPDLPFPEVLRTIAVARLLMPASVVRLAAGRARLNAAEQALCFLAGANSIFSSETRSMLTAKVPSPDYEADRLLLEILGLRIRDPDVGRRIRSRATR